MENEKNEILESLYKSIQTFGNLTAEAENRDKLYRYNDALMRSLCSILEDCECDKETKMQYFNTTMEQYVAAMKELFPLLIVPKTVYLSGRPLDELVANAVGKSDPNRFDEIEEIEKFNPYHDERGRFATADGYASFTIQTKDPKKQHMADAAIAREKERAAASKPDTKPEKEPDNGLNDPKTIGGVKAGEPMSHNEADDSNANPNYAKSTGYQVNCQSCVVAYEARLRGYDVTAKANTRANQSAQYLSHMTHHAWIDPATGKYPDLTRNDPTKVKNAKQTRQWLEETVQTGERYTFSHGWAGRGNTGHIVNLDRDSKGNLRITDAQCGKTYTGDSLDGYLSRTKSVTSVYGTKLGRLGLLRVDNLQINPEFSDGIMEAAS